MKIDRYGFVALAFAWFGLFSLSENTSAQVANPAYRLSIATLNAEWLVEDKIHARFDRALNNPFSPSTQRSNYLQSIDEVAKYIAAQNPDVLVLTEIGGQETLDALMNGANELLSHGGQSGRKYKYSFVCICSDTFSGQKVGVLSKRRIKEPSLPKILGRQLYRAEEDDQNTERDTGISKGLKFTLSDAGVEYTVYAVHLKSERGESGADAQRVAQAEIIRRHVIEDLKACRNVIVIGDLNDKLDDPTLRAVRGFSDINPKLIQSAIAHEKGPFSTFLEDQGETRRFTHTYNSTPQQIDHILFSRSFTENWGKATVRWHHYEDDMFISGKPIELKERFQSDHVMYSITFTQPRDRNMDLCEMTGVLRNAAN